MPKHRHNSLLVRDRYGAIVSYPILGATEDGIVTHRFDVACVMLAPSYIDDHMCYVNSIRTPLGTYAKSWKNLARRIG